MLRMLNGADYLPSGAADANVVADGWFGDYDSLDGVSPGRFSKGKAFITEGGPTSSELFYQAVGNRYTSATCVMGQAFFFPKTNNGLPGTTFSFGVYDAEGGTGVQMMIQFTETGVIRMYRGNTLVATSPADKFHFDEWIYVEFKIKVHATDGLCEVRVNTVTVISYVGNTQNGTPLLGAAGGWDTLYMASPGGTLSKIFRWDDFYLLDNTGSDNTDYLGNVRVNTQFTVAPGDLTQFSRFGPETSNWDTVNGTALDDSQYVYDGTVGDKDLYTMDPNVVAQNIFGIQVRGAYRQDDATQMTARNIIKTGGTIYEGGDHVLSGSYRYYRDIWEKNPSTGVGWTAADLNGSFQAGTKVQAIG